MIFPAVIIAWWQYPVYEQYRQNKEGDQYPGTGKKVFQMMKEGPLRGPDPGTVGEEYYPTEDEQGDQG